MAASRMRIILCLTAATLGRPTAAQESQRPTSEHKVLAAHEGTWDATITSYLPGRGGAPTISKGTEVNTVLAGGLWLVSQFEANIGGKPFQGRGQFGYAPLKKKYVGTWVDSMSPHLSVLEGEYDPQSKSMTYEGEYIDYGDRSRYTQRLVLTHADDGTRSLALSMKRGQDAEVKIMEIKYTKR